MKEKCDLLMKWVSKIVDSECVMTAIMGKNSYFNPLVVENWNDTDLIKACPHLIAALLWQTQPPLSEVTHLANHVYFFIDLQVVRTTVKKIQILP